MIFWFDAEAVRRRIEDATRDLENLQFETERTMKRASKAGAKVSNQDDEEDGDFEDFEERQYAVGSIRGHHVYTGESLLEMVLADHSFKYNHDKYLISGALSRGEHKVVCDLFSLFYFFYIFFLFFLSNFLIFFISSIYFISSILFMISFSPGFWYCMKSSSYCQEYKRKNSHFINCSFAVALIVSLTSYLSLSHLTHTAHHSKLSWCHSFI